MVSASEFRNGVTIQIDSDIFVILEFQHVKPGKGAAFVRTKLKNLISGSTIEKTFRPNEKFSKAHIEKKDMQYLYNDGQLYYFMDNETYEQIEVNSSDIGNALDYVKENDLVKILTHNNNIFGIEPAMFAFLKVEETDPGFKGDTATGAVKPAKLETGASVNVPLFINSGDIVKIDTRTGEYLSRENK